MKNFYYIPLSLLLLSMLAGNLQVNGQYYYKDIISTRQINETFRLYASNKVKAVKLTTFNGSTPITEGFLCEQKVSYQPNRLITYTKTSDDGESWLTALYNTQGLLVKSTDSSRWAVSISTYQYNPAGQLMELLNESKATDNSSVQTEVHNWEYDAKGRPVRMIKVRNRQDTLLVKFLSDEKGNTGEEEAFRQNASQGKIFYYYDNSNRLTDVVRYNSQAGRLMPDYMFEYEDNGELATMTLAPQPGAKFQKWFYRYDDNGLKLADFCYNLREELQGKVEYEYDF